MERIIKVSTSKDRRNIAPELDVNDEGVITAFWKGEKLEVEVL